MNEFRILILFASSHGQTRKVAEAIACRLSEHGAEVDVFDAGREMPPSPDGYNVVGIGSHVIHGKHDARIQGYIDHNLSALLTRSTFFFSVSLTAARTPQVPDPGQYISDITFATVWRPDLSLAVGGALPYREYNVARRLLMKAFRSPPGQPPDTTRNYEFTDWGAVRRFADTIASWRGRPLRPDRALGARVRTFS